MCELLGLNSNVPVQPRELLCRFGAHGGDVADNPDGWGIAQLAEGKFAIEKEPHAAARSARFRELCTRTRSSLILAHVRKANPPTARVLANTHPFRRVCCGREWVFAHNGVIPDAAMQGGPEAVPVCVPSGESANAPSLARGPRLDPIGDTDSEHAFCVVLDRIAAVFSSPQEVRDNVWLDALARTAEMLASHGRFNFLMSDGENLIAYGHDRLHSLNGASATCCDGAASEMAVIATEPLTEESGWQAFEPGELRVYRAGRQIARFLTRPRTESIMSEKGQPASSKNGASP